MKTERMMDTARCQKFLIANKMTHAKSCALCGLGPCTVFPAIDEPTDEFSPDKFEDAVERALFAIEPIADEQALKDAVVEAGITLRALGMLDSGYAAALTRHDAAIDAYLTHLTPKPVPAPRCEPPEWAKQEGWHWLKRHDRDVFWPWFWYSGNSDWRTEKPDSASPEEVHGWGWRYHSVAEPAKPQVQKVEASDEAMIEFINDGWYIPGILEPDAMRRHLARMIEAALAKFIPYNPEPLGRYEYLDIALRCGMKRCTSPGKPDWFELTVPAMEFIREFARAIEAKVRGTA